MGAHFTGSARRAHTHEDTFNPQAVPSSTFCGQCIMHCSGCQTAHNMYHVGDLPCGEGPTICAITVSPVVHMYCTSVFVENISGLQ